MTDLREAAQMALDALEKLNKDGWILADFEDEVCASIEALRAALAQPEPTYKPMHPELRKMFENYFDAAFEKLVPPQPEPLIDGWPLWSGLPPFSPSGGSKENQSQKIYRTIQQREWVGLTNEEFAEILCSEFQHRPELMLLQVQAKLKEKNSV